MNKKVSLPLLVLSLLMLPANAEAAKPRGTWSGTYTVATRTTTRVAVQLSLRTAVVALEPGHAARTTVPVRLQGRRVRFTVPGRPPLVFFGRIREHRLVGSVRQGRARGTFRLSRARRLPGYADLGVYELDGGSTLGLLDFRGIGLNFWAIELESSAFHRLYGSGPSYVVGAGVDVRAPEAGTLRTAANGLDWAGRHGTRMPARRLEVRFGSPGLGGTLTLPPGTGPFPAAAVVHGSGPSKREEGQYMTSVLLRRGIAVLAYDKRGNGQSSGSYPGEQASPQTVDILARDAQAAAGFLAVQPEIDARRIGLVGGSQAGWIIPLAASRAPQVSWALIESGPVVTVGESDFFASLTGQGQAPLTRPIEEIEDEVRRAGPSGFDPLPSLRALRIPIYWAYGGLDRHQPTGLDVPVLQQLRAQTGADYTWRVFPNGDHGLFEVQTGRLSERRTSRGLSPDFVPSIDAWLRAHGLAT
jgi:dienelactone hydrolase